MKSKRKSIVEIKDLAPEPADSPRPFKISFKGKQKAEPPAVPVDDLFVAPTVHDIPAKPARPERRSSRPNPRKRKRSPTPTPSASTSPSPTPPPLLPLDSPLRRIKRVRLVQRPPYTHPAQIPPLPKHGRSLRAFLDSYRDLGDEDLPQTLPELLAHEREEAALRARIDAFRRDGRLLPAGFDIAAGLDVKPDPDTGGPWRAVVAEVQEREGRKMLVDTRVGADKVAQLVGAHFGKVVGNDEQRRRAEEKRLRKLAKETIRDVTNEWRKAVFVSAIRTSVEGLR